VPGRLHAAWAALRPLLPLAVLAAACLGFSLIHAGTWGPQGLPAGPGSRMAGGSYASGVPGGGPEAGASEGDSAAREANAPVAADEAADEAPPPRVSLNRATRTELEALPGIGPALAGRILEFRATHGPFRRASELLLVRGIGPKKWAALRPLVRP
jgi:competence protein ComEA